MNERPFYVMDFVDGHILRSPEEATAFGADLLPDVTRSLIEVLAGIHAVDVDSVGLGELGSQGKLCGPPVTTMDGPVRSLQDPRTPQASGGP